MDEVKQRYLSLLPDLPLWVETRDLLLRKSSRIIENPTRNGFVIWSVENGSGSVVGDPEPDALAMAADKVSELLAFPGNIDRVRLLLPHFRTELATVFSAPEQFPPSPPHPCRRISRNEIAGMNHLPEDLLVQLSAVARYGKAVVAAFDGAAPVAFAFVASETESLWDVSIDTIAGHRRQGYASAAVLHLMRIMRDQGKSAVWGALDSNRASANLARRLGFVESDRLWVVICSGIGR